MQPICCPAFDRLVNQLIDTYRQVEDNDVFRLMAGTDLPDTAKVIRVAMVNHRDTCPICREADRARPIERVGVTAAKGLP